MSVLQLNLWTRRLSDPEVLNQMNAFRLGEIVWPIVKHESCLFRFEGLLAVWLLQGGARPDLAAQDARQQILVASPLRSIHPGRL